MNIDGNVYLENFNRIDAKELFVMDLGELRDHFLDVLMEYINVPRDSIESLTAFAVIQSQCRLIIEVLKRKHGIVLENDKIEFTEFLELCHAYISMASKKVLNEFA